MRLDVEENRQTGFGVRTAFSVTLVALAVIAIVIVVRLAQLTG